nr:hypothetical protein OHA15_04130 [Streptomyces anthocyanicus]
MTYAGSHRHYPHDVSVAGEGPDVLDDNLAAVADQQVGGEPVGVRAVAEFIEVEARFPEDAGEIPVPGVSYVAQQVKVTAERWAAYDCQGRRSSGYPANEGRTPAVPL